MKLPVILACLTAILTAPVFSQERAATFDATAARSTLSQGVKKEKSYTKSIGPDPIKERAYTKDAIVVTRQSGLKQEHPYVPVPLLFRVNTDQLLDATSRENVIKLAQLLKDLGRENATFAIEGHASAEGDALRNEELSNLRALRIQSLLREHGVPARVLGRTQGLGSKHAQHQRPNLVSELQLQEDRRVLVVKER